MLEDKGHRLTVYTQQTWPDIRPIYRELVSQQGGYNMRKSSHRGKYVISTRQNHVPVVRGSRVTKIKHIKGSTPVKTGLLRGYIGGADGQCRNVKSPTLSPVRKQPTFGFSEHYSLERLPGDYQDWDHPWVMSSTLGNKSISENDHQRSKPSKGGEKLKRKESKKEGKSGKKVEKEKVSGGGGGGSGSTRRSRSRRKVGLFACTAGQRSRSCTPERNATLSCRLPVSLDLESLDLQLAAIMAKQRDNAMSMYSSRMDDLSCEKQAEPIKVDSDSENTKTSFFKGLRRLSLRRRTSMSKKGRASKRPANDYTPDPAQKKESHAVSAKGPREPKDTISTSSLDSGISSTENSIRRQCRDGVEAASRPVSVYRVDTDTPDLPLPCVGAATVRMGTRGLERRMEASGQGSQPPPLPLRNRPLPQPSLIRTNINAAPPQLGTTLVKTIKLDKVLKNKWISGIAITRKLEYVVVDMREAYLLDEEGNLKRNIGNKDKATGRLYEPIAVSVLNNGNLMFSDHSEQDVKLYNSKGQFLGKVQDRGLTNIAGVAANDKREIFIAGTDRRRVSVHSEDDVLLYTIPCEGQAKCLWEHPYSIAINPLTGDILVGDDNKQLVTAVCPDGKLLWKFSPVGNRHFFPSSICADQNGYVFIADLYNEKVYMLDCSGKYIRTILARGDGLKGGPGAIAVDGRGHLVVADEERTIKVFKYGDNNFAMYRRSQYNGPSA